VIVYRVTDNLFKLQTKAIAWVMFYKPDLLTVTVFKAIVIKKYCKASYRAKEHWLFVMN
jgi:hypothetical protein